MNKALLRLDAQNFIKNYTEAIPTLALKGSPFENISTQELIQQIEGYQKTNQKLPLWHNSENIYYPPKINLEQTSSEVTANYKASIVNGKSIADITGGLGIDSYYFSKKFETVSHFEENKELSNIASYNFNILKRNNVSFYSTDGLKGISNEKYDVIYVDPSRRHSNKGKVFFLKDCQPNIVENLDYLLDRCDTLLIKTSPMLDLSVGLNDLQKVFEIHILAVNNDVKELLWILTKSTIKKLEIKTVNFNKDSIENFNFFPHLITKCEFSNPKKYLYEPNAAIMKSGGFEAICKSFDVFKLSKHSHLYTSDEPISFSGRSFTIERVIPYNKKEMKPFINSKANISTRNFPVNVAQLKQKWKIKDGGDVYLFFTSLEDSSRVLIRAKKLKFP